MPVTYNVGVDSLLEDFSYPVLVAGNAYAVHSSPEGLKTVPPSLANAGIYNGVWIVDSNGKSRHVKETVRDGPKRRSWNPFRKDEIRIEFVFDGEAATLSVDEVKVLLFAGFARHAGVMGSILAALRARLEPAQTLSDLFRILTAEQDAWRRTL